MDAPAAAGYQLVWLNTAASVWFGNGATGPASWPWYRQTWVVAPAGTASTCTHTTPCGDETGPSTHRSSWVTPFGAPAALPARPTIATMPIDFDVARVARLARLALDDDELARMQEQLGVILEHAARVQALPTDGVPPTSHPLPMVNSFRPDEVRPPLPQEAVLSQAPDAADGYFRVPPILEQE